MPIFTIPIHEANDCHNPAGSPEGGQFCSKGGADEEYVSADNLPAGVSLADLPSKGQLMDAWAEELEDEGPDISAVRGIGEWTDEVEMYAQALGAGDVFAGLAKTGRLPVKDYRQFKAPLVYRPVLSEINADLGAPDMWEAPNGVPVYFLRDVSSFHDFYSPSEMAIPITLSKSKAREALRAWADTFMRNAVTVRWKARQFVRPGD